MKKTNPTRERWKRMYRAIRIRRSEIRKEHEELGIILSDATIDVLALKRYGILYP